MFGCRKYNSKWFLWVIYIMFSVGCLVSPALAREPRWRDVPDRLKTEDGTVLLGQFLYATGTAQIENIRPDKAHDIARKKSLLRALQLIHIEASCPELLAGLGLGERKQFIRLFAPLLPSAKIHGMTVLRQWEQNSVHFTAVAVPLAGLKDLKCPFPDLQTAISHYMNTAVVSLNGLAFCLQHAPRYSELNRVFRKRIGLWFQKQTFNDLARCFLVEGNRLPSKSPIEILSWQNRYHRAGKYVLRSKGEAEKNKWGDVAVYAGMALDLVPTYGQAERMLSDAFRHAMNLPSFSLCAAEKALRDGTCLEEALVRIVACLHEINSPEKEIFQFLLSKTEHIEKEWSGIIWSDVLPVSWKGEMGRFADNPVQNLVVFSLGHAIEGNSEPPSAQFNQAATLFGNAKNDNDVQRVLDLLLHACEKQPSSAETHNLIGACYRHLGQPSLALPFLWQALTLKPEYDFALTNLGLCCQKLGLMEAARYYFNYDAVKYSLSQWVQECYAKFQETNK